MKPRLPTPEERKLWHESNQHTRVMRRKEEDEREAEAVVPSPSGGRLGRGRDTDKPREEKPPSRPSSGGGRGAVQASLSPLTIREANKRFKPHQKIEATLDLHGLKRDEAEARVQQFLTRAASGGKRHVVIITGKGKGGEPGVLRTHLPHWLNSAPVRSLISSVAYARPEKGGEGVLHVLLRA